MKMDGGVFYVNTSNSEPGEILSSINEKPVLTLNELFLEASHITTAPVIPETIIDMRMTFAGCSKLTGTVIINANPNNYESCFIGTSKPIILKGNSNLLNDLAKTSYAGNITVSQ